MKRRDFIQISSLSLASLLAENCASEQDFDVDFLNDMAVGHLAFESREFPVNRKKATEYLIVGGGIAGLSAAYQLRDKDFLLCELSDLLGGSSASSQYKNMPICHGAHYDLAYPQYYGAEALNMLSELGIVRFDRFSKLWQFADKQYLIPKNRESQTYAFGQFRKDVLPESTVKMDFIQLMSTFSGAMPMPTRLIDKKFHDLNNISFLSWLKDKISLTQEFIEGLDYHMKDDYGAGSEVVSALAGIHYFTCRPYYTKTVELFSPPEGNAYFVGKLFDQLPPSRVLRSHLVKRISEQQDWFDVEIVDVHKREIVSLNCDKIIYAGHKHSLKYIFPKDYHLFQNTQYAPWVVVNIILGKSMKNEAFWQNEMLITDKSWMGFTDSRSQHSTNENGQVLTAYLCFRPEEREMMSLIAQRKHRFVNQILDQLEVYFDRGLKQDVEKVVIKQMGHAMPIPGKGYLFNEANEMRSKK